MYCIDFPAYVFCGRFHCEVGVKGESQIFECGKCLEGKSSGRLILRVDFFLWKKRTVEI